MELWARAWTALVMAALGIVQLAWPDAFFGCTAPFRRARRRLSAEQSARLQRVLDARRYAEGTSTNPSRYTGLFGLAAAGLEFVPYVPFVLPYAAYCLAASFSLLATYLNVRRATERRSAPLVRRSPFDAFPPVLLLAIAGCLAGVTIVATDEAYRASAIGVAAAMLILAWIAWRIAGSQALMFGDDPALEYAVDERLRFSRTTATAATACAPAVVLVGIAAAWMSPAYDAAGVVAAILTYAAFAVVMVVNALAARHLSDKLVNGTSA
jgi:hypothetical protein